MTITDSGSPTTTMTPLRLTIRCTSPGVACVAVDGEVDMATAPGLQAALLDALASYRPVVLDVDLSACTFLDCSGIRVLITVHTYATAIGCRVWARRPQRLVRLVLEVTGLLAVFTAPADANLPTMTAETMPGAARPRAPRAARRPAVLPA